MAAPIVAGAIVLGAIVLVLVGSGGEDSPPPAPDPQASGAETSPDATGQADVAEAPPPQDPPVAEADVVEATDTAVAAADTTPEPDTAPPPLPEGSVRMSVTTEPPGAQVTYTLKGEKEPVLAPGVTPLELIFAKGDQVVSFEIALDGYKTRKIKRHKPHKEPLLAVELKPDKKKSPSKKKPRKETPEPVEEKPEPEEETPEPVEEKPEPEEEESGDSPSPAHLLPTGDP